MRTLQDYRSGKPASYPDQAIYAEYACDQSGLAFTEIDGGSGLVFSVAAADTRVHFAAGRCSLFPQNNATASTLATDKYFANLILAQAGVATLGGQYFFLHDRYRARARRRPRARRRAGLFSQAGRRGLRQAADRIARRPGAGGA